MERKPAPQVEYRSLRPSPRLAPYVAAFDCFRALDPLARPVVARNFPAGGTDLILNFGDAPRLTNRHATITGPVVVGPKRRPDLLELGRRVDLVVINLRPGGASALFGTPVDALCGQIVPLDTFWEAWAVQAVADLCPLPPASRLPLLERLLFRSLDGRIPSPPARAATLLVLQRGGRIRVAGLAAEVGLSVSALERAFRAQVGLAPKPFARQVRFDRALRRVRALSDYDWADLALAAGYADQAHLVREFVEFAGMPPARFARTRPNADFLQDAPAPAR